MNCINLEKRRKRYFRARCPQPSRSLPLIAEFRLWNTLEVVCQRGLSGPTGPRWHR